jgi:hypothetical protein
VFTQEAFEAALSGDESRLAGEAGPGGHVRVAGDWVLVAPDGAGKVVLGRRWHQGGVDVSRIPLPDGFRVREVAVDDGRFALTGADGRVVRGTPEQFTARPKLLDPELNPRHRQQVEEVFLMTHLLPERNREVVPDPPTADVGLGAAHVAEIARAGQVAVPLGGDEPVWVRFDCAGPEKVVELLPHARTLLASFERLGREAAAYVWARIIEDSDDDSDGDNDGDPGDTAIEDADKVGEDTEDDDTEDEIDEDEFLEHMVPTGIAVYLTGDFELHFEGASGTVYLDGYWPSVQFTADGTPVGVTIEA